MILLFFSLTLVLMISSVGAVTVEYSNYTEDFVDNNTSDVDSFSDLGTHSTFDNEKASDSTYDTLTEEDDGTSGSDTEDFVDQISDLHPADTDVGTHSAFAEMQDADTVYDTLTEEDTGGAGVDEDLYVNGFDSTDTAWTETGASPYLDAQDQPTNIISTATDLAEEGYFTFPSTSATSGDVTVTLYIYCKNDDGAGNDIASVFYDHGGGETDSGVDVGDQTTYDWDTVSLGSMTYTQFNALKIMFRFQKITQPDDVYIDAMYANVVQAGGTNYDLDLEVGWTNAPYTETNVELCIYGGTQGAESLRVDVWDEVTTSDWVNVISDLATGWNNNVSIKSYINSGTVEIRFTDTSADSTTQDTWQVDGVLIHGWTVGASNYELDLEVQFTTITATQYGSTEEWLCIETGTLGAENIKVDIWYSSAWQNLYADLDASTWNNISISAYLDSATATIRFKGGTETGDTTTQDTWQIDSVLIKTYSYACSQTISEVIDISSSTTEAASMSVTNSEVIELSDSESESIGAGVTISEVIPLQESIQHAVDFVVYVFEVLEISETVTVAMNTIVTIAETIGLAVSLTISKKCSITISEVIGLAETISVAAQYVVTSYQEIAFAGTLTAGASYSNTFTELIELVSSVSTSVGGSGNDYSVTIYAIIGFGDSISDAVSYVVTSSQVIGFSDSLSNVADFVVTHSEVIAFTGTLTAGAGRSVTINDLIGFSESLTEGVGRSVTINEVIDLGDSVTTIVNYVVTSNQVIPFSESVTTAVSYSVTVNEVIEIISSVSSRIPGAPQQYQVIIYEIIDFSSGTSYDVTGSGGPITGTKYEVIINEIIPIGDRKHRRPSRIDFTTLATIGAAATVTIIVVEYKTEVFRESYATAKEWINDAKEKLSDPKPKIPKPKTKPDEKIKLDKKTKKPKVRPEPRTPKKKKIPKKVTSGTPTIDIKTIQKQSKPMQSTIMKTGKVKKSMVKSSKAQKQKTVKIGRDMEKKVMVKSSKAEKQKAIKIGRDMEKKIRKGGKRPQ